VKQKKDELTVTDLLSMAKHAAAGMSYLEGKKVVHRDLALRNLLVTVENSKYIVKISDFGLSRQIESGIYTTQDKNIPVKWCSPEVLELGEYSSKSDVWGFGVVLWELFSYGKIPYTGMSNAEAAEKVSQQGYRMPAPDKCPEGVYDIMRHCWRSKAKLRPSFAKIFSLLDECWKSEMGGAVTSSQVAHVADVERPLERAESFYNTTSEFDSSSSMSSNRDDVSEMEEQPNESFYDIDSKKKEEQPAASSTNEKKEVEEGFYATT